MKARLLFILCLSVLLSSLICATFNSVKVKASDGYPVHNDETELDYMTIQEAINAPQTLDGHTISVDEGIYYEHVVVNKSLSLIGTNKRNTVINGDSMGTVILVTADNVTITEFMFEKGVSGILIQYSNNCEVHHNYIVNNAYRGILVTNSGNFTVSNNTVSDTRDGYGINANASVNGQILQNVVCRNYYDGIGLLNSSNCRIAENSVVDNTSSGILVEDSSNDNWIYHNNFIDNGIQNAAVAQSTNQWNDSYPSGGNYWSDYTGVDANSDGIGDTPYTIDENNTDGYPLMNPFGSDSIPPFTIEDYDGRWHTADFTINLTATDIWSEVNETCYKINSGSIQNKTVSGQPLITVESANNTLEYWSVDNASNEEFPHRILAEIKLDKTNPSIDTPSRVPDGDVTPDQSVQVSVNVTDVVSGVKNVILPYTINNGTTWTNLPMNINSSTKLYEATIPPQSLGTWVKYKIVAYDDAGNNATLDGTEPYCTYQVIPEFTSTIILSIFMTATLLAVIIYRRKFFT